MHIKKYRIIEESDLMGETSYFVDLYQRGFFGYSWVELTRWTHDFSFKVPSRFSSMSDARNAVYSLIKSKKIVEEKEV